MRGRGQTCKYMVPGFDGLNKAEHGGCIPTGDRSRQMADIIRVTAAQITPPGSRERDGERKRERERESWREGERENWREGDRER